MCTGMCGNQKMRSMLCTLETDEAGGEVVEAEVGEGGC